MVEIKSLDLYPFSVSLTHSLQDHFDTSLELKPSPHSLTGANGINPVT